MTAMRATTRATVVHIKKEASKLEKTKPLRLKHTLQNPDIGIRSH
jgi:hypothetical protein